MSQSAAAHPEAVSRDPRLTRQIPARSGQSPNVSAQRKNVRNPIPATLALVAGATMLIGASLLSLSHQITRGHR